MDTTNVSVLKKIRDGLRNALAANVSTLSPQQLSDARVVLTDFDNKIEAATPPKKKDRRTR